MQNPVTIAERVRRGSRSRVLPAGVCWPMGRGAGGGRRPDPLDSVVQVSAVIRADARTADTLGTEREGSGVVIDDDGLILTIGYLILEAIEVESSARGRSRSRPTSSPTITRAGSACCAPASRSTSSAAGARRLGHAAAAPAGAGGQPDRRVRCRRGLRGRPADVRRLLGVSARGRDLHRAAAAEFGGAALIDEGGRLVGIGSLVVNDAGRAGPADPRQHVRADQRSQADPRRPAGQRPAQRSAAAVARADARGASRARVRDAGDARTGRPPPPASRPTT